ncbi:MarR family transcriptional regulator [Bifidobacterium sp. SO4]|uniref:MarR family winged helix-turn-helix transcriptional regulator n=1 Tax=Bifidobacterium sp. SO4 TaxID=2809030 RepID=UPI001BDCBD3C|nr:MarR family transcriptional regulator [Bifidobacterium sp. SO4]MBT1170680.1 MarR family transcriptional regulator [Bifidobacterium sp. SO4]
MDSRLPDAGSSLEDGTSPDYVLESNIGFLLRVCNQRSTALFAEKAPEGLSSPRFAALAKLVESGPLPQNRLGRLISIDAATIKGVVDRLQKADAVSTAPNPDDKRQRIVSITERGRELYSRGVEASLYTVHRLCEGLEQEEVEAFAHILRHIAARADR